jgi:cob(I)alamin adenosyltransferase
MVNLTRIYTRTGDAGTTRLVDNSVAPKTDPRVEAYGTVDEASSVIGIALAMGLPDRVAEVLTIVQQELFDLGSDLATPLVVDPPWEPLRILQSSVDRLERWCDEFGDPLPNLRSFILPGGSPAGAYLHLARTVCRRAERRAWSAVEAYGTESSSGAEIAGGINPIAVTYLNRLSDLLFILTRVVNGTDGEILWVPGGARDA